MRVKIKKILKKIYKSFDIFMSQKATRWTSLTIALTGLLVIVTLEVIVIVKRDKPKYRFEDMNNHIQDSTKCYETDKALYCRVDIEARWYYEK